MTTLERYNGHGDWSVVGRGRTPDSVARRIYGRSHAIQPDSGVPHHGVLIRYLPPDGTKWQATVLCRVRWSG